MPALPLFLSDVLPDALTRQNHTLQQLQQQLFRFGYQHIDSPLVEKADLFLIKAGDAAINRLVSFDLPGRTLCLRPEFTVPAARAYITHYQDTAGPLRLQFAGPILQYDNLSHGQIQQQNAIGAELINEHSAAADAEIIALTGKMLVAAGITNTQLAIGHAGIIHRFLDRYNLNRQMRRFVLEWLPILGSAPDGLVQATTALAKHIAGQGVQDTYYSPTDNGDTETALRAFLQASPQRGSSGSRTREEIARRLLDKQQQQDQQKMTQQALQDLQQFITHIANPQHLQETLHDDDLAPLAEQLSATFKLLKAYDIPAQNITFDLSFTRNLDYYTGIVFEYRTADTDHQVLGGGGRYDELIRLLGGKRSVPAVGSMIYVDRVLATIQSNSATSQSSEQPRLLLQSTNPTQAAALIALATRLRAKGYSVTTHQSGGTATVQAHYTKVITLTSDNTLEIIHPASGTSMTLPAADFAGLITALETIK